MGTVDLVMHSKRRARTRRWIERIVFQLIVTAFALLFAAPLVALLLSSVKSNKELISFPPTFLPQEWTWSNWPRTIAKYPFALWYKNTLILAVNAVVGSIVSNTLVAYGFSRIDWLGRNALFALCLGTMLLPGAVTQIPVYITGSALPFFSHPDSHCRPRNSTGSEFCFICTYGTNKTNARGLSPPVGIFTPPRRTVLK